MYNDLISLSFFAGKRMMIYVLLVILGITMHNILDSKCSGLKRHNDPDKPAAVAFPAGYTGHPVTSTSSVK